MDKKEIMQIGDLKATGNTWKLILMRLVSGIISYFIVIISLLTFKIKYFDVIIFMYMGLFNFFEIGIKSTCLNYVRGETEGVDLSDIFYALKTNQIRFIGLSLLSVMVLPLLFLFELFLYNIGIHIRHEELMLIEVTVLCISMYLLFIIPYLAIDYPEESIIEIIKTGIHFERKIDFILIFINKLTIPIIYIVIMILNKIIPNKLLPNSVYYTVWIVGGVLTLLSIIINLPRVDMAYAVLYNNVIKTYYEDEEEINPYIKDFEESYHEYGDFKTDEFVD
jgi:hypothetical protein